MGSVKQRLGNVSAWANFIVLVAAILNTLLYLQTMTYEIRFDDQVLNERYDSIITIYERDMRKVEYQKSARSYGGNIALVDWAELAEQRFREELANEGCPREDTSKPSEGEMSEAGTVIELTEDEYRCDFTRAFYSQYPSPEEAEVVEAYIKERPLIERRSRATYQLDQAELLGGLWVFLGLLNYVLWGRFRIMPWRKPRDPIKTSK